MTLEAVNPATGEQIREYDEMNLDRIEGIAQAAHQQFLEWKRTPFDHRAGRMRRAAAVLRENKETYARLMAQEMGKPVRDGRGEVEKCAWVCEYYAQHAERFLADESVETDADKSFVTYRPLGVLLAVMPWNFPFWQVFRFAAPGLMAGNAALLKHASNVPGCGLAIEEVFDEAGFPPALFRTLLIGSGSVEAVIRNPTIRAVTLTGSVPAGRAVAEIAGSEIKKTVLELGGSDPYLILSDADVSAAAATCATSRLINSGQSCIAAKRFVVVQEHIEEFQAEFRSRMSAVRMGDPLDDRTELGPQARHDLRDDLHRQVKESLDAGAELILGGEIPEGAGAYYPATILGDVKKGMPAYEEELFGPVAAIIPVGDDEEAVRVANDSNFGLGAAVFTGDQTRGERIASEELEAGACFVNAFVRSDPRLPFGGVKWSGYGRELSHHGIREFVNIKTVYVG
jgi:succinate-semialdehyde dehydrogenase/glutarate-semialdehyde dehydrogenase